MMPWEVLLLDIKKTNEEFGLEPAVSLVDGIRQTWVALNGPGQD